MRSILALAYDVALVLLATALAIELRLSVENRAQDFATYLPYMTATALMAAGSFYVSGSYRSIWRYASLRDCLRVSGAAALAVTLTVLVLFVANRLEGIARSLPLLQVTFAVSALVGGRVLARVWHGLRRRRREVRPLQMPVLHASRTVLVMGLNDLTEMYLRVVAGQQRGQSIRIAGMLGSGQHHVGRQIGIHSVLGRPEQVTEIIRQLSTHGVYVDEVVVTAPMDSLPALARVQLDDLADAGTVAVTALTKTMGLDLANPPPPEGGASGAASDAPMVAPRATATRGRGPAYAADAPVFEIPATTLKAIARRPYWRIKRVLDAVLASVLLIVLAPIIGLVALIVAIDCGTPVMFWQQRPGLSGRPFRVFKFRTMRPGFTASGRKLTDEQRLSRIGRFLRGTRLDELPQLWHIAVGQMSFVGPRPLLPADQPAAYRARLMVRPGLTGWAQVVGGRTISANDKAALDIWYVLNAGLWLDLSVALRTVAVVLRGERVDEHLIERAWADLRQSRTYREPVELQFEGDIPASGHRLAS